MTKEKRTSVHYDRKKREFVGLDEFHIKKLSETFKSVDISAELNKMALWLESPKGESRKGQIGFILNWLKNVTPSKPALTSEKVDLEEIDPALRPLILDYLQGLWKNREHILEFNKIRKSN